MQSLNRRVLLLFITLLFFSFASDTNRIISLDPSTTEILYQLDLGAQLVGRDARSDHPEGVKKISVTSNLLKLNREKILSLQANWLIGHDLGFQDLKPFAKKHGIKVLLLPNGSLEDLKNNLKLLGKTFSRQSEAQKIITNLESIQYPQVNRSYLLIVDNLNQIVVGQDSYISKALARCGLKNLSQQKGYPKLDRESFVQQKADYIFSLDKSESRLKTPTILLDGDLFGRFTPRFYLAVFEKCQELHSVSP